MSLAWLEDASEMHAEAPGVVLHVRAAMCGADVPPLEPALCGRLWGRPAWNARRLEFLYRGEADRISDAIQAFRRTRRVAKVLGVYLDRLSEDEDVWKDSDCGDRKKVLRRLLRRAARGEIDPGGYWEDPFHVHASLCEEGGVVDTEFGIATQSLDLPAWAELEDLDGGGPGSGYLQPAIFLAPDKTFQDLGAWLMARDEENLQRARRNRRRRRRALFRKQVREEPE